MSTLSETKSWMTWWGWTNGGGPGAVKLDVTGNVIARHRDSIWQADVDKAYELARKERARAWTFPAAEHR